ncbi:hypothetical protein CFP56_023988 [Quercus suber]|uniref:Uncharacterized protein n=1 Tax=Quercus suber TaxID=58331 RepID=A0AAW0K8A3_QUESU
MEFLEEVVPIARIPVVSNSSAKRGDETEKGDVYTEKEAEKERGDESKKFHKTILPPSKRQAICQQSLWHSLITVIETRTSIFGIYIPIWISLAGKEELKDLEFKQDSSLSKILLPSIHRIVKRLKGLHQSVKFKSNLDFPKQTVASPEAETNSCTLRTSACAFSITFGFLSNSDIAHSKVVAAVSPPASHHPIIEAINLSEGYKSGTLKPEVSTIISLTRDMNSS